MGAVVSAIFVIVVVAVGVWVLAATFAGMAPASHDVMQGDPVTLRQRVLNAPVPQVMGAYKQGVKVAPGCRILKSGTSELVIDSKPSVRLLGGAFGIVMTLGFTETAGKTSVTTVAAKKVNWAPASNHEVRKAAEEIERRIRMAAKRSANVTEAN